MPVWLVTPAPATASSIGLVRVALPAIPDARHVLMLASALPASPMQYWTGAIIATARLPSTGPEQPAPPATLNAKPVQQQAQLVHRALQMLHCKELRVVATRIITGQALRVRVATPLV